MRLSLSGFSILFSRFIFAYFALAALRPHRIKIAGLVVTTTAPRSSDFNRDQFTFMLPHRSIVHRDKTIRPIARKSTFADHEQRLVIGSMHRVGRHAAEHGDCSLGRFRE